MENVKSHSQFQAVAKWLAQTSPQLENDPQTLEMMDGDGDMQLMDD